MTMKFKRRLGQPKIEEAKLPPDPCIFCGKDTTRSTKFIQGAVLLRCDACKLMGIKGTVRSDWVKTDDPDARRKLQFVVEQNKRWAEIV